MCEVKLGELDKQVTTAKAELEAAALAIGGRVGRRW
jgi:hypothetical protein